MRPQQRMGKSRLRRAEGALHYTPPSAPAVPVPMISSDGWLTREHDTLNVTQSVAAVVVSVPFHFSTYLVWWTTTNEGCPLPTQNTTTITTQLQHHLRTVYQKGIKQSADFPFWMLVLAACVFSVAMTDHANFTQIKKFKSQGLFKKKNVLKTQR